MPVLANKNLNSEQVNDLVCRDYLDLVIYYRCVVSTDERGFASFVINKNHTNFYNLTENELYEAAVKNYSKNKPVLMSLTDMLRNIGYEFDDVDIDAAMDIFVLTNSTYMYGATSILCDTILDKVAQSLDANRLYILPSSIHETLILDAADKCLEEIEKIVNEVNSTVLDRADYLSDTIYEYNTETKVVTKAV